MNNYTREVLLGSVQARENEVTNYQINIDNYRRAIARIDRDYADDPAMQEFRARLTELLSSSLIEQRKEQILLDVIREQLEEADAVS